MSSSGFVLLDKIAGETSFKALFPLKRVFCTKRVGHAGTLDLRASGLIIAATGRATRLLPYIEAKDKCYTFRLHLGYETDTLEWDGEVVEQDDRSLSVTRADLEAVLPQFIGDIDQVPPNYSAVKIDGHRESDLANRGREIELKPRRIHIESLKVVGEGLVTEGCTGKSFATFDLECNCSKGTYIRSLGRDLARALGTCGCVSMIRRHRIGDVTVDRAVRGLSLRIFPGGAAVRAHLPLEGGVVGADLHIEHSFEVRGNGGVAGLLRDEERIRDREMDVRAGQGVVARSDLNAVPLDLAAVVVDVRKGCAARESVISDLRHMGREGNAGE